MVKIVKTNSDFEYPRFRSQNKQPIEKQPPQKTPFLTQNNLLGRLAPSKRHSRLVDLIKHIIKIILQCFRPVMPSRFESRLVRLMKKGPESELFSSEELFSHYTKWLRSDQAMAKKVPLFERFQKHEEKLQDLARLADKKDPHQEAFKIFKEEIRKDLSQLKDGESRLFAFDHMQLPTGWHNNLFCVVTKTKDKWSLTLTGSGSVMKNLSKSFPFIEKEKVQRDLRFTDIPTEQLLNDEWLTAWTQPTDTWQATLNNHLEGMKEHAVIDHSFEALTTKTDRFSKLFWNLLSSLPTSDKEAPALGRDAKLVRLRTHLAQLFELYQRHRYQLKPESRRYQHLKIVFENVSREVIAATDKGDLSADDLQAVRKELQIIENALLKAKSKKILTFTGKAPDKNLLLLGVQSEDFKAHSFPADVKNPILGKLQGKGRQPAPLKLLDLKIEVPIEIHPARAIQTKDEALKELQMLHQKWTNQPKERAVIQQKILHFFQEVPVNLFHRLLQDVLEIEKTDSFWWTFTIQERKEIFQWVDEWMNTITKDEKLKSSASQTTYEALAKMHLLTYAWEADNEGYQTSRENFIKALYHNDVFGKFHSTYLQLNPSHLSAFSEYHAGYHLMDMYHHHKNVPFEHHTRYWIREQDHDKLVKTLSKELPQTSKMRHYLQRLTSNDIYDHFLSTENAILMKMKPIQSPFLAALFQLSRTIIRDKDPAGKEKIDHTGATHEAFQTDPESVFNHFFDKLNGEISTLEKEGLEETCLKAIPHPFAPEEEKRLLHLLRLKAPQSELLAFLEECPHLMRNPDVRNFFQALFFGPQLVNFLSDRDYVKLAEELPSMLEEKFFAEKVLLEKALKETPHLQDLIKGRFEVLAFLLEMHTKLKGIYRNPDLSRAFDNLFPAFLRETTFKDLRGEMEGLLALCEKNPILEKQKGYLAQVLLQDHFLRGQILPESTQELFHLFALGLGSEMPFYQKDPLVEDDLHLAWERLLAKLDEKSAVFQVENVAGLLDQLCIEKKLQLDDSVWESKGNYIYHNASYEVDLRSFSVKLREYAGEIETMPAQILSDETFKKLFPEIGEESFPVQKEQDGGSTRYSFLRPGGTPALILQEGKDLLFYRQSAEGKWLQYVPPDALDAKDISKMLDKAKKTGKNKISLFFDFLRLIKKVSQGKLPALLAQGIYIDPQDPLKGVVLNESGKELFRLQFVTTKDGLELKHIQDLRGEDQKAFQLNLGTDLSPIVSQAFRGFENPENLLLWSQKGKLQKVELQRYGMTFEVKDKRLVCTDPKLKGYHVVMNPSLSDKKQIACALMLEHSDPKKPRKLLLPSSRQLQPHVEVLEPKAIGFAKIILLFKQIYQLIQLLKGKRPEVVLDSYLHVNPKVSQLSYTSIDLRPFTEEIVINPQTSVDTLLEIAKHYLTAENPIEVLRVLEHLPVERKMDQATLNKLLRFIQNNETKGSASIKLKLALRLKAALKKSRSEKKVIQKINELILKQGEAAFAEGGKLPRGVALTKTERLAVARLAQKSGSAFFHEKVLPLAAKNETEWDMDELFPDQKEAFESAIASWKETNPRVDLGIAIHLLEEDINPDTLLEDADMQYGFKRLAEGQEFYRLFEPKEIASLFKTENIVLPQVTLNGINPDLEDCEKYALNVIKNELEDYRQTEGDKKIRVLSASSGKLRSFLKSKVLPKKVEYEKKLDELSLKIERRIRHSNDPQEQLEIFSGKTPMASFDEIKLAFSKGRLQALKDQKRLPKTLNINSLENDLTNYFETLVRRNALEAAEKLIQDARKKSFRDDPEQWKTLSRALHHLLTLQCLFDAKQDPRFLIFEAQQFLQFKALDAGLDQLQLLEKLLNDPRAVVQAPTGSGKTAVFSVLRSLLKPNGKNLVIQKVMPQLYQQTYDKYREVIGDLFGASVYALRFNLKMRLTEIEYVPGTDENHQPIEVKQDTSVFKRMYHDLLKTIKDKGCVLTDYKSLPLLEERFWKLGQDLVEATEKGLPISRLDQEHFHYLQKIMILLENKADENMDEFDEPNRPIHKIQIDMGVGSQPVPAALIEGVLEIYDLLLADKDLKLVKNVTDDLTEEMRIKAIQNAASTMGQRLSGGDQLLENKLIEYFLGKNEDVLPLIQEREPAFKDKVVLSKDEFFIFLPLTLRGKEGSRYTRSDDGLRTLPCQNGDKHEAKHGTLLEQLNYMVQDYYQAGITKVDLKLWLTNLQKNAENAKDQERELQLTQQLQGVFPDEKLHNLGELLNNSEKIDELVQLVNAKPTLIQHFLKYRLSEIRTSGAVVSMEPQQIIDMSAAVSGVSATMGAPASLHPQFRTDEKMNGKIRAQMTYRVAGRALQDAPVLLYDPEDPKSILQKTHQPMQAFIDGAGAFRSAKEGAEALLAANPALSQVGYYQTHEDIVFAGKATGELDKTGFFFSQAFTRGTDRPLSKDAKALMTLAERDGLRDYFQKEGRLRQPEQKYQLAISNYRKDVKTIDEVMTKAAMQDSRVDAKDIYKASAQRLTAILRKHQRKLLKKDMHGFIELFKQEEVRKLFITKPQPHYPKAGDYFELNKHIRRTDEKPEKALADYKKELIAKAERLNLPDAKKELEETLFSDELLRQMPAEVTPIVGQIGEEFREELEMELQVEQEEEVEAEEELEVSLELEKAQMAQKVPLGAFPARTRNEMDHSIREKIHPAYDDKLHVSDSFLPLSRAKTASLRKRTPFDAAMYRVGVVFVKVKESYFPNPNLLNIYLEDPLGEIDKLYYGEDNKLRNEMSNGFWWDIRTQKCVKEQYSRVSPDMIVKSKEFTHLIAQVKFFDGQTHGYSEDELKALSEWLRDHEPKKMRDHLLNQVLQYRYQEKIDFAGSQLEKLFRALGVN